MMRIVLQQRDLDLIAYVYKFRVSSYAQLIQNFFKGRSRRTAQERINELYLAGYLYKFSLIVDGKSVLAVGVAQNGFVAIYERYGFKLDKPHLKSESPLHDIRFANVAQKFTRLQCFSELVTDNLLQSSTSLAVSAEYRAATRLESDGLVRLQTNSGDRYLHAIEFELSKKSPERYKNKLAAYYACSDVRSVLYVCASQQILTAVAKANAALCENRISKVFCSLEASVLEAAGPLQFSGMKETKMTFT